MKRILLVIAIFLCYLTGFAQADVVAIISDGVATYTAGTTNTYTITITNNGLNPAVNVNVNSLVPAGIDPSTVTWSGTNGSNGTGNLANVVPTMTNGQVIIYTVIVPIPANFPQTQNLVYDVAVTSTSTDPDTSNNTASDIDTPNALANLVTTKTANGFPQYLLGSTRTYTITVTNQGPSDALNVNIVDNLPSGTTNGSWIGPGGTSGVGNLNVIVPVIAVGESLTYTFQLTIPQSYNVTLNVVNTVNVSSDTVDPSPSCPNCSSILTPAPRFVTITNTQYSIPQLITDVLIDSECAIVSNFTAQPAALSNNCGIGYFQANNSTFPFQAGVVIRNGTATATQGHYTGNDMSSVCSGQGDPQLLAVSQAQGNTGSINDVSFIRFNFTPLTDNFSFNFLMASNEYGTFQCGFADVFAFLLTNITTGVTTNVAVIPGTTIPVSVLTIRDVAYNAGCPSVNPEYFGQFNQTLPPADTPINMRGQTVVFNASATVIPNNQYSIKLTIGDYNDSAFDSAVFIEAGSFNVGSASVGGTGEFEGFGDLTIANGGALCPGLCKTIRAGSSPIANATYQWSRDGVVIAGETTFELQVCEAGEYCATVLIGGGATCQQTDCATVEVLPIPDIQAGNDLYSCNTTWNLTQNSSIIINNLVGEISYHTTLQDALDVANPIPNTLAAAYPGTDGQIIYAAIQIDGEPCIYTSTFQIFELDSTITPLTTVIPALCDVNADGLEVFDFSIATINALNGLEPSEYTVTYHTSLADATNDVGSIDPTNYNGSNNQIIYIRVEQNCDTTNFEITQITLTLTTIPVPDDPLDVATCDCYTLPTLTVGNYFTGTNGTGTPYNAGDSICGTGTLTLYVFAETSTTPNNCTAENSFTITFIQTPTPSDPADVTVCDSYQLPTLASGNYFGGTGGTGTAYFAGDILSSTMTMYVYQETGTSPNCFAENSFLITINPTPIVDILPNVTVCDSYTLPTLVVGGYYSGPGGTGTTYNPGQNITGTSTLYIYAESGTTPNCFTQSSFVVTVNITPIVSTPSDVVNCGPYTLPSVAVGNYYSGPAGTGTPYFAGDLIPASMTMYLYAETATVPNCFTQSSFDILIVAPPTIVDPSALVLCDDDNNGFQTFNLLSTIPQITAGQTNLVVTFHETLTDSQLGVTPIANPGAYPMITPNTQTIYINVKETGATSDCAALTTLQLIVNPRPVLNNAIADYELCDYNNPGDGIEVFDLTTRASEVTNNQAGLILAYAYDNAGVMTPIATPTAFSNTTPNQQVIFVTATNSFGCSTTTQFNVVVNPLPAITPPDPMYECNDGVNLTTAPFDLTERNNQITGGLPGFSVSYYLTLANAQQEINPLPIPYTGTNGQIVYVRVENDDTTCFATTTLQLFVVPGPIANTPTPLSYCDPNNDNIGIFDLTSVTNQITAGETTSVLTYHETFTDADLGVTAIANPSNYSSIASITGTQTIYIRVTSSLTACYAVVELQLLVNPTPVLVETALPLQVCDDNADGIGVFDLTQSINNILNGLSPALHTVSFHTTQANAQADSNPIINVLNFSNSVPNTQVIWVRVEINATGCYSVVPLTLTVNALPSLPLSLPSYSLCETDPENEQELFAIRDYVEAQLPTPGYEFAFYFSEANADAGINALPDTYQNVSNPQTIWIVVTNETTGCTSKTVLDLRVEPRPILLIPVGGLSQCDANGEGYGNFDLAAEIPNLLNGATGVEVTFYETEQNAILEVVAIPSPYENITPYLQYIYIRAEDTATGCFRVYMMALNVSPSPIIPTDLPDLVKCDQDNNPQSGTTTFDLTQQNALINAAQPQGLGTYTIRYFTTEANAQNNTSAIVNTTNYPNFQNPQTIWYRVINNATGCYSIGTFQLIVNLPLALTTPTPLAQCNPDNDNFMVFDLTTKDAEINQGTGYTVTYYPSYAQALTETNPITNPTAYTNLTPAQTLGVVVTTPDGCKSYISLTIRVLPTPIVVTPPLLEACDNTTPGDNQEAFDLTTYEDIIRNNDPDITFEYYPTQADAIAGTNQIVDPTAYVTTTGSVWIKAMNLQQPTPGEFCYTLVEQLLQLNPLPTVAATVSDYVICEPNTDGQASFVLSTKNAEVVAPQDPSGFAFSYYLSLADAQAGTNALPNNYTNTTNPQTVYVRVVDVVTGCVNATVSFDLLVEEGAIANSVPATTAGLTVCDEDGTNDGFTTFDLTPFGAIVLGTTQTEPDYALSYFESQADAQAGQNAIANPANYTNTNNPQEIWIRVTNTITASQCASLSMITLIVNELPELVVEDGFICVDPVTSQPLGTYTIVPIIDDASLYTYVWYFNGDEIVGATDATYTTSVNGNYGVIATNIATGCMMLAAETMSLVNTSAAIIGDVIVSNAFSENQTITVNLVGGIGDYEYQLDNGPFQDSNVFTNVSYGEHTVTVRDKNNGGCDTVSTVVTAINYPLFFTPNGDGFNDTWNIVGLANQPNAKIYIFDRYGKLIKQISPTSTGWDGTFNGRPLPSTDYWFTVTYEEESQTKEFKAHFSLKR